MNKISKIFTALFPKNPLIKYMDKLAKYDNCTGIICGYDGTSLIMAVQDGTGYFMYDTLIGAFPDAVIRTHIDNKNGYVFCGTYSIISKQ